MNREKNQRPVGVKFPMSSNNEFYNELKRRVDQYFIENNLSFHGNYILYLKSFILIAVYVAAYTGIISDFFNIIGMIFLYSILGIAKGLIGFNVIHDALHGSYSRFRWVNHLIGYWFDLNGTSSLVWKISHNQKHHIYTNIPGYDDDINKAILLRLNPLDKIYWFHRFQHIYAFILYSLIGFNWMFYSDYAWFFGEFKKRKVQTMDLAIFLLFKLVNVTLFLILPLIVLSDPWWSILLGYSAMQICGGILISIVFQQAHIVENVQYFKPNEEGTMKNNWVVHELLTTSNFSIKNKWLTHCIGGLNFQIEHHLFPQISHVHYFEISKIVKSTATEFHLPYLEYPTFWASICSHVRMLKSLASVTSIN